MKRWAIRGGILLLVVAAIVAYRATGLGNYLTLESLKNHQESLNTITWLA